MPKYLCYSRPCDIMQVREETTAVSSPGASFEADLPMIVAVHFADVSDPLVVTTHPPPVPTITSAPLFVSHFLSEDNRWSELKNSLKAIMSDPDSRRGVPSSSADASRDASASSPAPAQLDNQLEQWQGPPGGVDLSRFPRDGVAVFGSEFSTLRGPAFQRLDTFRGFEVHILRKGGGESQYGFCTPDFKRGEGYTGEGCGDDGNSWAWDG
jgi:hypothetical protein